MYKYLLPFFSSFLTSLLFSSHFHQSQEQSRHLWRATCVSLSLFLLNKWVWEYHTIHTCQVIYLKGIRQREGTSSLQRHKSSNLNFDHSAWQRTPYISLINNVWGPSPFWVVLSQVRWSWDVSESRLRKPWGANNSVRNILSWYL